MEDPLGLGWVVGGFSYVASIALSLAEGALSDFSWTKVETLARSKKVSERIGKCLKREDDIALASSSLKVGANVLFVLAAMFLCMVRGASAPVTYIVGAAAMAGIILGADVPAFLVGRRLAEPLLVRLFPVLDLARFILQPALWASRFVGEILARILGYPETETQAESIAEDLRSAATEGRHEGVLREEEEDMIEGILRFKEREISDVMTPRADMAVLSIETPLFEAAKFALEKGFSRIPVFRENSDDIVGVFHVRDLLQYLDPECKDTPALDTLVRPPFFTPESRKVAELFQEMRGQKVHMALVIDEFGGTEGLITIEDILEEIVGEIEDEYDPEPEEPFRVVDDRTVMVDGRFRIDDLNDRFQVDIPENNGYDTVGGYLSFVFGHVPERGKVHEMDNVVFTVMDADPRKVRQVQIQKREEA